MALTAIGRPALILALLSFWANVARGAGPRGRRGITAISISRRRFTRDYALDDRRRVEPIANASPPHEAESCRGSRPASNAALFDILRFPGNLIARLRYNLAVKRSLA